jgi:DNA polymerase-3 subunit gamma/tau
MAQQSLYRRYRPGRFADLRGQAHVVQALRNAVATGTAGQAYLFSGPRGTGKTTSARLLAKALNCTNLHDGEPCGECESCLAMEAGNSYDLFELDAASNNGVDAMRDLISRAAVGSPGRTKVYILDEVHMLSAAASNALLKTLEEPPDHVTFVLATTDPQKVLPTIRSRTQHFEFSLLTAEELEDYVRWVVADAGLDVDDDAIAHVVRAGRGSARDTLSALDQVVAAGGVLTRSDATDGLLDAIAGRNTSRAMVEVASAIDGGRDPRVLGESLLAALRDAFLVSVGAGAAHLAEADRSRAEKLGATIGAAGLTRALEALGAALIDMRQAADPRIPLEVALVRITDASTDASLAGLAERVAHLERELARRGTAPSEPSAAAPAAAEPSAAAAPAEGPASRPARPTSTRPTPAPAADAPAPPPPKRPADIPAPPPPRGRTAPAPPPPAPAKTSAPAPAAAPEAESTRPANSPRPASAAQRTGDLPSVDELSAAMPEGVLTRLKGVAKAIYTAGHFVEVADGTAVFALANAPTRERAEKVRRDVEAALEVHFGRPVPLRLVEEGQSGSGSGSAPTRGGPTPSPTPPPAPPVDETPEEHTIDVAELTDAHDVVATGADKLTQAFPGAMLVEEEP